MSFETLHNEGREGQDSLVEAAAGELLRVLRVGGAPSEPLRRELLTLLLSARRTEGGTVEGSGEIWNKFVTKVARAEHALLKPEDKAFIGEIVYQMKDTLVAFRVSQTKPIGATKSAIQEDYSAFDIISADFNGLDSKIVGSLSQDIRLGLANRASANHAILFPHPTDANLVVLYSVLNTPQSTSQADSRTIDHKFVAVLRRGPWLALLERDGLRHFPFILSGLGMQIAPSGREVFFDGSFASQRNVYGAGESPMSLIDVAQRRIFSVRNISNADAPSVIQFPTDTEFKNGIRNARGDSYSPETFSLCGPRLGAPRRSAYERNGS